MAIDKREEIAKVIKAETEGGYLEYWDEFRELLSPEQQWSYFLCCADVVLALLDN